jgi:hypothetical protein
VVDGPVLFLLHRADRNLLFGLIGEVGRFGQGQRLAGNYPGSEKQMTDEYGRDKDSIAEDH